MPFVLTLLVLHVWHCCGFNAPLPLWSVLYEVRDCTYVWLMRWKLFITHCTVYRNAKQIEERSGIMWYHYQGTWKVCQVWEITGNTEGHSRQQWKNAIEKWSCTCQREPSWRMVFTQDKLVYKCLVAAGQNKQTTTNNSTSCAQKVVLTSCRGYFLYISHSCFKTALACLCQKHQNSCHIFIELSRTSSHSNIPAEIAQRKRVLPRARFKPLLPCNILHWSARRWHQGWEDLVVCSKHSSTREEKGKVEWPLWSEHSPLLPWRLCCGTALHSISNK